jgi:hypothetical protein
MAMWSEVLEHPRRGEHLVQLYGSDEPLLARNVSRFLAEGLRRGDGLVVIATPAHEAAFRRQLFEEYPSAALALEGERLVFLDAQATLGRLSLDGGPHPARFRQVIGDVVHAVRERCDSGHVRGYGEMVALLWCEGHRDAAIRLEEYWNDLLREGGLSLFCAYPIDIFSGRTDLDGLRSILEAHTHACAGPGTTLSSGRRR